MRPRPVGSAGRSVGLQTKLVALLLAFGLLPLAVVIMTGYAVARATIVQQASESLLALARAQATHVDIELNRERLLLRTIAGQLTAAPSVALQHPGALADLLLQSLPESGVFDGLRMVTPDGVVVVDVALRNAEPHWPSQAPAAHWEGVGVSVHREGETAMAYLVAVPVRIRAAAWLEGHVKREDFQRVFAIPEHIVSGVESAIFDAAGWPIVGMHAHATLAVGEALSHAAGKRQEQVVLVDAGGSRSLLTTTPVPGTD